MGADRARRGTRRGPTARGASAQRPRALWLLALVVALADCRCRTRYDGAATRACNDEAMSTPPDPKDPLAVKKRCEDCCRRRGLDSVDPGACECGDLGLDVLMK